ncbi:MAG: hypothetical protein QOH60_4268 [Mycobacterium sp.]|jgi:nucleoside-diphosphate-sugar epimerase|nr:hypothetical protein [Mycobacterium sp.]
MRVFVTGASGFIGSAVASELIAANHDVLGLARSDSSAEALSAAGVLPYRGDIEDLDSLRAGAANADGVIHLAYNHDFTDYAGAAQTDRCAIDAIGETLAGSGRPMVVASGMVGVSLDRIATEEDHVDPNSPRLSEDAALQFTSQGVKVSVVRLPPTVHGDGDRGFVPGLIDVAREKKSAAYPGDGTNRWPAVHRLDAARLFRLALEAALEGARLHAIGDEGIPVRDIAGIIGRKLQVQMESIPRDDAFDTWGFIGMIFSADLPASSALTQKQLGWQPTHAGLLDDLEHGSYF